MRLILASNSIDRRRQLERAGFSFDVIGSNIEEVQLPGEEPGDFVVRIAGEKGRAVAAGLSQGEDALVVSADTMIMIGSRSAGKAPDDHQAREDLRELSGQSHTMITGLSVIRAPGLESESMLVSTRVVFRELSESEISSYVATGEYRGRAGSYSIQDLASAFVDEIHGSPSNVLGLPMSQLHTLASRLGVNLFNFLP